MSGFEFQVSVPADEWATMVRRVAYLEAVLLQVLKDEDEVKEWFDAGELIALRLPGLPISKAAITRTAASAAWRRREVKGRGGVRYQYHCTSLPERAFEALVSRILGVPEFAEVETPDEAVPAIPAPLPSSFPENTAPPWVLPFMRLLKTGAHGNMGAAWRALPQALPRGVAMPTEEEAAEVILSLGIA